MKTKLLRKIRRLAHDAAHIDCMSVTSSVFGVTDFAWTIGYVSDESHEQYKDIMKHGMLEDEFDRRVSHRYWQINKEYYYEKFKKCI